MWQPICRTSTDLADRLAGIEQAKGSMARGDAAELGRRIDEPRLASSRV
jgi:hypothetical protein